MGELLDLLVKNTSTEMFAVILISFSILLIYGYFDCNKKTPGHPGRFIVFALIPTIVSLILSKYSYEKYGENIFLVSVSWFIATLIFYVSFVLIFIASYKKGYAKTEVINKNKILFILAAIGFGAVVIWLGVISFTK